MAKYRFVGTYATTLANGQPVEPGEFVNLSDEDAGTNEAMLADGLLIGTGEKSEEMAQKAERKSARQQKQEEG